MRPERREAVDFSRRAEPAELPEWMDEPCSYGDFRACLVDIATFNRLTLAYRSTLRWLDGITAGAQPLHIVDVGCGGGDLLRAIEQWAARRNLPVKLTGIDLNAYAARAAREFSSADLAVQGAIDWITGDAFSYQPRQPIDIIVSSLFTHHLPTPEVVRFLTWMEATAQRGWLINDLRRSSTGARLFRLLAKLARWHRFVEHDGPVSVRRSFREDDWQRMATAAGIDPEKLQIVRVFPGRLCVRRTK